jgi:formylglycine-generating enzyme required for sulfatase activity
MPGGKFTMGAGKGELEAASPEHIVYVDTFCLEEIEVTVDDYRACVNAGRCPAPPAAALPDAGACNFGAEGSGKSAMNCVSWGEASALCASRNMRLPTEAEWELAASKGGVKALDGGVAEWVADYYAPYTDEQAVNPTGPTTGSARVVRGGAPADLAAKLGGRFREGAPADKRAASLGFRCARAIE